MKRSLHCRLMLLALLVGLASLSFSASAQSPCQGSVGPDVIVGDIQGVFNYTAVGSLEALSLGTTSCNVGKRALSWNADTNQHPVIAGNLYRFRVVDGSGRFEQVGVSWLKHGFFALGETFCCASCVGDPDGLYLGVGCSDPYSAFRNGDQSGLGPRYQVNPHTGAFPYPPTAPTGGNTGRVEVSISDLEPSSPGGTRYFGECTYLTPDDAVAGNQDNNASYRELDVTGSGSTWNFALAGSTFRETAAIRSWPSAEPGAVVKNIQLANEGILILGFKTTPLGGGQFHYEYALYNMNSDLAVGTFGIPVPAAVSITNVEFHDVTYRGGDGVGGVDQDGTDWSETQTGGLLIWATSTFAQDPNANAIRWGTTYNFRFDADAAPANGTITIGTFKDGGSIETQGDVPGETPGTPFCTSDGTLPTACPCSNSGALDRGCANSQNGLGALLTSSGTISPDTVSLTSWGELPSSLTIFLQGDALVSSGQIFGDGVRCVGGTLKRLYAKDASYGVVKVPVGSDPSISARSAALGDPIFPGSTRYYQCYYRDPSPSFCPDPPGSTFNISGGQSIVW